MFKKLIFTIVVALFVTTLSACDNGGEIISDTQTLINLKESIVFDETEVSEDIVLPEVDVIDGLTYSWSSNKTQYITDEGIVTRPSKDVGDVVVQLTLKLTLNGIEVNKVIELTVLAEEELSDHDLLAFILDSVTFSETDITNNLTLPVIDDEGVTATWVSSREATLSHEGIVTRPGHTETDLGVILTLTVQKGSLSVFREYTFTVLKEEAPVELGLLETAKAELVFTNTELIEDIVIPLVSNQDITVTWASNMPEFLTSEGVVTRPAYNEDAKTVILTATIELGLYVQTMDFTFTVLQEDRPDFIELDTEFTDALVMDFSYENKDFIPDGYGEVDLVRCVDGDTAIFTEGTGSFSVRFLGINTPESTYKFEPWGKAASTFTCDKLTNATTIVLEYDPSTERTDGNGRYLGWVWYDGRLLNLELVEEAYTGSKGVGGSRYENTFYLAEFKTQDSDRRIWGEDDPDFDYSLDGVQITIEELVTNQAEYVSKKVVIRGVVSRQIGGHPYIQDNGFGIYLFKGFAYTTKLAEGNEVLISGLTLTYYPDEATGAPQLTGFSRTNIEVLSEGNVVTPKEMLVTEFDVSDIGSLVEVLNLTVVSIYENSYDSAFTVTAEDQNGNVVSIRRDDTANSDITADLFTVGTTFDIVAPLGRYQGQYQLMISKLVDITFD
jgi:micrococcal nuclease